MKLTKSNFLEKVEKGYCVAITPAGNIPVRAKGLSVKSKNSVIYKNNELRVIALLNPKTNNYVPVDSIVDDQATNDIKSIAVVYPYSGSRWHTDLTFYIYSKLRERFRNTDTKVVFLGGNKQDEKEVEKYDYRIYICHCGPGYGAPKYDVKIVRHYFVKSLRPVIKSMFKKFGIDVSNFDAELDLVLALKDYAEPDKGNDVTKYEGYYNSVMNLIADKQEIISDAIKNEYGGKDPFYLYFVFNSILAEAFGENVAGPSRNIELCRGAFSKLGIKASGLNIPMHIYAFLKACKELYTPKDAQTRNIGLPINILDFTLFARTDSTKLLEMSKKMYPDSILYFEPLSYRYYSTVYISKNHENLGYDELVDFLLHNREKIRVEVCMY